MRTVPLSQAAPYHQGRPGISGHGDEEESSLWYHHLASNGGVSRLEHDMVGTPRRCRS